MSASSTQDQVDCKARYVGREDRYILIGLGNRVPSQWKVSVCAIQVQEDNSRGQLWWGGMKVRQSSCKKATWQSNLVFFTETSKVCLYSHLSYQNTKTQTNKWKCWKVHTVEELLVRHPIWTVNVFHVCRSTDRTRIF